jgi:hypothetical protein
MTHDSGCMCHECRTWFQRHANGPNVEVRLHPGCGQCGKPLDDHQITKDGAVLSCPKLDFHR